MISLTYYFVVSAVLCPLLHWLVYREWKKSLFISGLMTLSVFTAWLSRFMLYWVHGK